MTKNQPKALMTTDPSAAIIGGELAGVGGVCFWNVFWNTRFPSVRRIFGLEGVYLPEDGPADFSYSREGTADAMKAPPAILFPGNEQTEILLFPASGGLRGFVDFVSTPPRCASGSIAA